MRYAFMRIAGPLKGFDSASPVQWCVLDAAGQLLEESKSKSLPDAAGSSWLKQDCSLIVLLPGDSIFLTHIKVNDVHNRHLMSVISDQIEDQLAQSVDEIHLILGRPASSMDGNEKKLDYPVAFVDEASLRGVMEALADAALVPHFVMTEALLMPCGDGAAFALSQGRQIVFRFSPHVASRLESETFATFLDTYLAHRKKGGKAADTEFSVLRLMSPADEPEAQQDFQDEVKAICARHSVMLEMHAIDEATFPWLCRHWLALSERDKAMNFLQGPYGARKPLQLKYVRKAAYALMAFLFCYLAFDLAVTAYCSAMAAQAQMQSEAIYRRLFPAETKIVDLPLQVRQHLRDSEAGGSGDFMQMLDALARPAGLSRHLDISQLSYDAAGRQLVVDFRTDDFNALERYKRAVQPPFIVDMGATVREENGVHGQMHIKRRP